MTFCFDGIGTPLTLTEDTIHRFVIEHGGLLGEIVTDLLDSTNGENGKTAIITHDNKELDIEKAVEVVVNPFCLDFNSKKMNLALQNYLKTICAESELFENFQQTNIQINALGNAIEHFSDFPVEFTSVEDISSLLKLFAFRVSNESDSNAVRLKKYIAISRDLCKKQIFVLVNISSFFSENQLLELLSDLAYQKICVLMLENTEVNLQGSIKTSLIDKDLCRVK